MRERFSSVQFSPVTQSFLESSIAITNKKFTPAGMLSSSLHSLKWMESYRLKEDKDEKGSQYEGLNLVQRFRTSNFS